MANIYCSNKLSEFIGTENFIPLPTSYKNPFGDWNAHLFTFNRKKNLIIVNNASYYAVILYDIKKNILKDLPTLFLNRLAEQLVYDGVIGEDDVLLILQKYLPIILRRTNNDKKTLGTINDFLVAFTFYPKFTSITHAELLAANNSINTSLTGAGRNERRQYGIPVEDMRGLLGGVR